MIFGKVLLHDHRSVTLTLHSEMAILPSIMVASLPVVYLAPVPDSPG